MFGKIIKTILFVVVVILSYQLRAGNFDVIPTRGQSFDEYSNSWVGLSLIRLGVPVGSSGLAGYDEDIRRYINVDRVLQSHVVGPSFINVPWFDHPPILGIITGGFAYLKGARVFEETSTFLIRKPMLILGSLTVALVMIFAWLNYGFWTGFLAGMIYGTMPLVVVGSRMIQGENGFMPLFLLNLIFLSLYIKRKNSWWLVGSAVASGLATLFKLSGIVCYVASFFVLFLENQKNWRFFVKDFLFYLLVAVPISGLFVVYGAALDWRTFVNVFRSNSNRFYGIGPASFFNLIKDSRLTQTKFLTDGWIPTMWLLFFGIVARAKKSKADVIAILGVLSYLMVYILFGNFPYGWYAFPFWPILVILMARIFVLGLADRHLSVMVGLANLSLVGFSISKMVEETVFNYWASWWRLGWLILLAGLVLSSLPQKRNTLLVLVKNLIFVLCWVLVIGINVVFINQMTIDSWYFVD